MVLRDDGRLSVVGLRAGFVESLDGLRIGIHVVTALCLEPEIGGVRMDKGGAATEVKFGAAFLAFWKQLSNQDVFAPWPKVSLDAVGQQCAGESLKFDHRGLPLGPGWVLCLTLGRGRL